MFAFCAHHHCAGIASSITGVGKPGLHFHPACSANPTTSRTSTPGWESTSCWDFRWQSILLIEDTLQGLVLSQVVLSLQLPFTIYLLVRLTSSRK